MGVQLNNLHIVLNEFTNGSRILKQTKSLVESDTVDKLYIAALHKDNLDKDVIYGDRRELKRFSLKSRNLKKNLFMQIFKYIEFCFLIYRFYKDKNIKMINIHTVGMLPLGIFLKYAYDAILIYDTHELETEQSYKMSCRRKLSKWMERGLIYKVDMLLVVSESIADWYAQEYKIERPTVVLNVPNKKKLNKFNHFRDNLNIKNDQLILLYQGALFKGRGIDLVIDAFKERKDNKIVLVCMGYGELEDYIKYNSEKFENIYFFPAVSPDIVLEYTSSADIGISLIQNTSLSYYYCMPNKLFEYAMAGLPVLVSNMKDMSDLVGNNEMGAIITDFSVDNINRAINDFLLKDLSSMKMNAYNIACQNSWEVQEEKMLKAYQKMLKKKKFKS